MTKFKLALIGILFSGIALAQSIPHGINYQAAQSVVIEPTVIDHIVV